MRLAFVVVCCLLLAMTAVAQSDRGTITGTVADPAGAVVANAPIQAKNVETGVVYEGASSTTGNYTLVQLPAGSYQVTVTVPGFKKYTRTGLTVQVAQTLRIDVTLEVGATSDSVTVTEAATLLKTESGELSHNVAGKTLDELPVLGIGGTLSGSAGIRNPYAAVQLIPGTTFVPNSLVRINGTPGNSQSFRIEGQDASNTGTPGVPAQTQPSVDAIQEFAIQTSNFAAEYGQVGGGVFNVTMKSGTNQFHGTAYEYFVNEVFNAGNPYTNSPAGNPRPRARRNDYGFTVGGPVWIPKVYNGRDKTFFFFSWEQFRETTEVNNQFQTVPIAAYKAGDFTCAILGNCTPGTPHVIGTDPLGRQMLEGMIYDPTTTRPINGVQVRDQFTGNRIPLTSFDPVSKNIQALFPGPSGPTPTGLTNNYLHAYGTHRTTEVPSIKADQTIGSKGKLSFFYQRTKTSNPDGNTIFGRSDGFPDPITEILGTFQNAPLYRLNYDHTLTATTLLHFGAGYRSNYFLVPSVTTTGELTNYDAEKELGLKGGLSHTWFPTISGLLAGNGTGGIKTIGSEAGSNQITQTPSFNASVTSVRSNHTYKLGSEFQTQGYPPKVNGNTLGTYTFAAAETGQPFQNTAVGGFNVGFPYASFLLGGADSIGISRLTTPRMGKKQFGLYVQDTWKVSRKLTLDYGLRYDYSTYLREQYGRAPEFSATTPNPSAGGRLGAAIYDGSSGPGRCNCDIAHNYPYAFGPRLGVAYQLDSKTVIRVGFGIVYGGTAVNNNAAGGLAGSSASNATPNFGSPITTLAQGYPSTALPPQWPNFNAGQFP
ncbi:MAG TPA: TonB-dependent receptor, partial [Bryobacteraceae bacterium]|nr:TonB-dependent receptor [Bryobacteraceae bacterium]